MQGIETCVIEINAAQRLGAEAQIRTSVERGIKRGKIAAPGVCQRPNDSVCQVSMA